MKGLSFELLCEGLVPCIVLLLGLCFVPESPRWLVRKIRITKLKLPKNREPNMSDIILQAKVGHEKEFQVALQRLRGKDADITNEATEIQVLCSTLKVCNTLCFYFFFSIMKIVSL